MIDSGMTIFEISTPLHAKIWSLQNERPVGGLGKASRRGQKRVHSWKTKSDPGYRVDRYGGLAGYMPSGENIGGYIGSMGGHGLTTEQVRVMGHETARALLQKGATSRESSTFIECMQTGQLGRGQTKLTEFTIDRHPKCYRCSGWCHAPFMMAILQGAWPHRPASHLSARYLPALADDHALSIEC